MKACFWWDSKNQHLFGWGSEKSSVSPCSARGNAIPGCMGFYEKQLYVEKGRWREPEKEWQHGKEGDQEWEEGRKEGGKQKAGKGGDLKAEEKKWFKLAIMSKPTQEYLVKKSQNNRKKSTDKNSLLPSVFVPLNFTKTYRFKTNLFYRDENPQNILMHTHWTLSPPLHLS